MTKLFILFIASLNCLPLVVQFTQAQRPNEPPGGPYVPAQGPNGPVERPNELSGGPYVPAQGPNGPAERHNEPPGGPYAPARGPYVPAEGPNGPAAECNKPSQDIGASDFLPDQTKLCPDQPPVGCCDPWDGGTFYVGLLENENKSKYQRSYSDLFVDEPHKHFFACNEFAVCAKCIAVALKMNKTLTRVRRGEETKYWRRNYEKTLGDDFCQKSFRDYRLRQVGDIRFIGDETISSTVVDDVMNSEIYVMLKDHCELIRSIFNDNDLYARWKAHNFNMIEALCRKDAGICSPCTKAKIKYKPVQLKLDFASAHGISQVVVDYFFNKHITKKIRDEHELLTDWVRYWN